MLQLESSLELDIFQRKTNLFFVVRGAESDMPDTAVVLFVLFCYC